MNQLRFQRVSNWSTHYLEDISQAFFFKKASFGAILLVLFLAFSPYSFACGAIASLISYAYIFRESTPKALKDSGLITVNGLFFGVALASLFKPSPLTAFFLLLGSLSIPLLTKAAHEILQHWKLSISVAPYLASIWILWLCGGEYPALLRHDIWPQNISTLPMLHATWPFLSIFLSSILVSIGRLLFLPHAIFGFCLLALVTAFSPRRGLFLLAGTAIASAVAFSVTSGFAWEYGLFSYCAGLIGLGLASLPEKTNWKNILFFCLLSSFLTVASERVVGGGNFPILSLPYVLTMWAAILSRTPRLNMTWSSSGATRSQLSVVQKKPELERVA